MNERWLWGAVLLSALVVAGYELRLARAGRRDPGATARSAHRLLRDEWVQALSRQPGSEIVAVQALRNSLMSATITASTAAVVLMGFLSLLVSGPYASGLTERPLSMRLMLEAALAFTLFAAFVCSAMSMRYYHHAGFVMSLPVRCPERNGREAAASMYVQRGGSLYSLGLRCFLFAAPIAVGLLSPLFMLPAAVGLVIVLSFFDGAPRRIDA